MITSLRGAVVVLFSGSLQDTATLVGLAQSRSPIGLIAYTGTIGKEQMDLLAQLNIWLQHRGLPKVLVHPHLTYEQLERIPGSPLADWGWGERECRAAIRLAGIPFLDLIEKQKAIMPT
jgi:hypothetical protein